MTMHQCPDCDVWLPVGHVHSKAECVEHVRQGRVIKARADVWRRRYSVQRAVQLGFEEGR